MIRIQAITLRDDSDNPLYLKLAEALRRALLDGEAAPGERLPSVRRLSDALGINPATAASAYRILEREGLVEGRAGSGVYATTKAAARGAATTTGPGEIGAAGLGSPASEGILRETSRERGNPAQGVLDLAAGTPSPDLFPTAEFKGILDEVLDRDGGWAFGYQDSAGWEPFRRALADYAKDAVGIATRAEDIRVVSGAQQGIDLVAKTLLRPGDTVLTEHPSYRGAAAAFWSRGADTLPLPMPESVEDLGLWEREAELRRPRLAYLIPRYQTPTGRSWGAASLQAVLDLAERRDFYILEDDLLSDLHFGQARDPASLKSMDRRGRVIYVRGFSKVLLPGLRLGMVILPPALRGSFDAAKLASDISTDGFMQRTAELYLRRGLYRARIEALRTHYGAVYRRLLESAKRRLEPLGAAWAEPGGGLHLWIRLPEGITGSALQREALARGAAVLPEAAYAEPARGNGAAQEDRHIRLSFASLREGEVDRAVGIVAEALAALLEQRVP